jgi:REP element-mobilizing transposase RayT
MARIARVVAPGVPHHVTQRGNRRQQTFFCEEDYKAQKNTAQFSWVVNRLSARRRFPFQPLFFYQPGSIASD